MVYSFPDFGVVSISHRAGETSKFISYETMIFIDLTSIFL